MTVLGQVGACFCFVYVFVCLFVCLGKGKCSINCRVGLYMNRKDVKRLSKIHNKIPLVLVATAGFREIHHFYGRTVIFCKCRKIAVPLNMHTLKYHTFKLQKIVFPEDPLHSTLQMVCRCLMVFGLIYHRSRDLIINVFQTTGSRYFAHMSALCDIYHCFSFA